MRWSACGFLLSLGLACAATVEIAADEPRPALPKVVLVGDSIRMRYAPLVAERLAGKAIVVSPKANGGGRANVLKHLDEWVIRERPDVVHFNCGIHDTKKSKATGKFQVPPEAYEANLRAIVGRIRAETKAKVLFATTTPVLDDRAAAARAKAEYELLEASAEQYNRIARKVMDKLGVPVADLRAALGGPDSWPKLLGADGIHFLPEGYDRLASAVTAFLMESLPTPAPAGAGRPGLDPGRW